MASSSYLTISAVWLATVDLKARFLCTEQDSQGRMRIKIVINDTTIFDFGTEELAAMTERMAEITDRG